MADGAERMTREEFFELVEEKAEEKVKKLSHDDGTALTKDEKKQFVHLYRKRAEVFWNKHGAPKKGAPVELSLESSGEEVAVKVDSVVERAKPEEYTHKGDEQSIDLAFLLVLIGFMLTLLAFFIVFVFLFYMG